jgi:hypothetical protein
MLSCPSSMKALKKTDFEKNLEEAFKSFQSFQKLSKAFHQNPI